MSDDCMNRLRQMAQNLRLHFTIDYYECDDTWEIAVVEPRTREGVAFCKNFHSLEDAVEYILQMIEEASDD